MRLDKFGAEYYAEPRDKATTTSTTFVDRVTLTEMPQAGDHLVLGCRLLDFGALPTHQTDAQLLQGAVEIAHYPGRRTGDTNIPVVAWVRARHPRSDRR